MDVMKDIWGLQGGIGSSDYRVTGHMQFSLCNEERSPLGCESKEMIEEFLDSITLS
jgi:hypothetical protein